MKKLAFYIRRKNIIKSVKADDLYGLTILFNIPIETVVKKLKKANNINEVQGILLANGCARTYIDCGFTSEEKDDFMVYMKERIEKAEENQKYYFKNDQKAVLECLDFVRKLECSDKRRLIKVSSYS